MHLGSQTSFKAFLGHLLHRFKSFTFEQSPHRAIEPFFLGKGEPQHDHVQAGTMCPKLVLLILEQPVQTQKAMLAHLHQIHDLLLASDLGTQTAHDSALEPYFFGDLGCHLLFFVEGVKFKIFGFQFDLHRLERLLDLNVGTCNLVGWVLLLDFDGRPLDLVKLREAFQSLRADLHWPVIVLRIDRNYLLIALEVSDRSLSMDYQSECVRGAVLVDHPLTLNIGLDPKILDKLASKVLGELSEKNVCS